MGNINLTTLFNSLGLVGGNTASNNQYEFYKGIEWSDSSKTYNQYEFFKKVGNDSRFDFFKPYVNEYEFYKDINDERIYDYYTFYKYAGEYLKGVFSDLFGTPDGIYSIRKLNSAYEGPCMRVRNGSREKDIAFAGGELDTADLLAFAGTENLFDWSENYDNWDSIQSATVEINTTETTDPFGGNNAAKMVATLGGWLFRDNLTNVVATRTYNISVWAKAVTPGTKNTFRFIVGNASSANITVTGEWVRYSTTIVANGTATGILRDSSSNLSELYLYGFQISEGTTLLDYTTTSGFISTGNAQVVKFYDQSGNGNDATQTISGASQPIIVEDSVLKVDENGKPAPYFDGVDDYFDAAINISDVENFILLTTNQLEDPVGTSNYSFLGFTNNTYFRYNTSGNVEFRFRNRDYDGAGGTLVREQIPVLSTAANQLRIVAAYNYNTATFSAGSDSTNDYRLMVREYDIKSSVSSVAVRNTQFSLLDIGTRFPSAAPDWFKGYMSEIIYYKGNIELYESDFSVDTNGWLAGNGTISATNSVLRFVPDTQVNIQHFTRIVPPLEDGKTYKITGEIFMPVGQTTFNTIRIWNSLSSDGFTTITTTGAWTPFNITIKVSSGGSSLRVQPQNGSLLGFTGNNSDYVEIRGITIDEISDDMKEKISKIGEMIDNINSFYNAY